MVIVGLGVIIQNDDGKILFGKRKNIHSPYYSIPGGKLDDGETFEEGAKREILEETGLVLNTVKVVGLTNNLDTYKEDKLHSISVVLFCDDFSGEPKILEPHKCDGWEWFDPKNPPTPLSDFCRMGNENWLNKTFYHEYF